MPVSLSHPETILVACGADKDCAVWAQHIKLSGDAVCGEAGQQCLRDVCRMLRRHAWCVDAECHEGRSR